MKISGRRFLAVVMLGLIIGDVRAYGQDPLEVAWKDVRAALPQGSHAAALPVADGPPASLRVPERWVKEDRRREFERVIKVLPKVLYNTGLHELLQAKGYNSLAVGLAIIKAESELNPLALSQTGAVGFMQLMPGTYQEMFERYNQHFEPGMDLNLVTQNNVWPNLTAGCLRLKENLEKFWKDPDAVEKAIAAYNGGRGRVHKAELKARRSGIFWLAYMPRETRDYVPKVKLLYRRLEAYNSTLQTVEPQPAVQARREASKRVSPTVVAQARAVAASHIYNWDQCSLPGVSCPALHAIGRPSHNR